MRKELILSEEAIAARVREMAQFLSKERRETPIRIVAILKGSFVFLADLIRHLSIPFQVDFITASSYGMGGTIPGPLTVGGIESLQLAGESVLLVDDIYDTGKTLSVVYRALEKKLPASLHSLVFLKKQGIVGGAVLPDLVCFDIEDRFVVGYGLDYKEQYRGLKGVYAIKQ